jgi:hypothetical protein
MFLANLLILCGVSVKLCFDINSWYRLLPFLQRKINVCISMHLRSSKFFLQYFILATLQTPRKVRIIITVKGIPVLAVTMFAGIMVPVSS